VRDVVRIYHRHRVANFRPTLAKALYDKYSKAKDIVLDFSAGYGGRLLGSLTLNRHYIGIDPETAQVTGLRRTIQSLRKIAVGTAEIHRACAEDLLPELSSSSVDLVFTSPPYFNNERYSNSVMQSFKRYPTYERWKAEFLRPLIFQSYRVLRSGGHLILNVADANGYRLGQDARIIAQAFFRRIHIVKMLMSTTPLERAKGIGPYKWEPIFICRKDRSV
jgi:DNA modification methylase